MFKNKFLAIFSIVLLVLFIVLLLIKINIVTEPFLEGNNYPNVYYINLKHRTDRKSIF